MPRRGARSTLTAVGLATLVVVVTTGALVSRAGVDLSMMRGLEAVPTRFESNGERIYFTAASESRRSISYTGGNMHLQMVGGGCATCHGADRKGRRMMPEFWVQAPPLTRAALLGEHGDGAEHREHARYDRASLRRAISIGLVSSGERMDPIMPHWSMSDEDWRDLLEYLME